MPSRAPGDCDSDGHHLDRDRVRVGLRAVQLRVQRLLADALAEPAAPGRPGQQLVDPGVQLVVRDRVVDQAPLGGGGRVDRVAGQGQLHQPLAARRCGPPGRPGCGRTSRPCRRAARTTADSAATARSQVATSWQPAAVAIACTRAITTCGTSWMVCISPCTAGAGRAPRPGPARPRRRSRARRRTPCPRRASTMPVASLRPAVSNASSSSRRCGSDSELRRSGRFMVIRTVSPSDLDQQVLVIGQVDRRRWCGS